jgi:subtilisin family serine protease
MKPFDPQATATPHEGQNPSEELRVAVTFPRAGGAGGPVKFGARLSVASATHFAPDPLNVDVAIGELQKAGFAVSSRGKLAVSMRCTRAQYEKVFGTHLSVFESPSPESAQSQKFYFPGAKANWKPDAAVSKLIDDAYIQWPHIYMAAAKKTSASKKGAGGVGGGPKLGYHYLSAPKGVQKLLNVAAVHKAKITGKGIRVAMIDSGFDQRHAWFKKFRAQSGVVLAAGASNKLTDTSGHGTGESANLFSVAPGVNFIGVKVDNDADPGAGASILEGFQEALRHHPHIITVSMGYDLRAPGNKPAGILPNSLVPLEAEIQAAIAAGVVVVFSAGNGHYAFPGQMPNVISAGGAYVDAKGAMQASNYSSAFPSAIYAGRSVPDVSGLVGMMPDATYIRLPIPKGCDIDRDMAQADRTRPNDGWGVFSGTSAAAPQIAGLCALLLQKNPGLSPQEVKAILRRSARDVSKGRASAASDPLQQGGVKASAGVDGATGAGLIDAAAALAKV